MWVNRRRCLSGSDLPRFIHLAGGLRAFDVEGMDVQIGVDGLKCPLHFPRPKYSQLYQTLIALGADIIGVEFLHDREQHLNFAPRSWRGAAKGLGWIAVDEAQEWTNIAFAHNESPDNELSGLASRVSSALRLLDERVRQLSEAYHHCLRLKLHRSRHAEEYKFFTNAWQRTVFAGVHAFLADAGILRDYLAEACWNFVENGASRDVRTMRSLLKRTKESENSTVQSVRREAKTGWIKNLTDLRNEVIHVVPVSHLHEFDYCELRPLKLKEFTSVPMLHLPLVDREGKMRRPADRRIDYSDENNVREAWQSYRDFSNSSTDALQYCRDTVGNLGSLATKLRLATGMTSPIPVLQPRPGSVSYTHR